MFISLGRFCVGINILVIGVVLLMEIGVEVLIIMGGRR